MSRKIKVLHIITGLGVGGAEMSLYKLVSCSDRSKFHHHVVSLLLEGPIADKIRSVGVSVKSLNYSQGVPNPLIIKDLTKLIRRINPAVIQTWMYHADLAASIATFFSRKIPVIWNIRHGDMVPEVLKSLTRAVMWVSAKLSDYVPCRIIVNSERSRDIHVSLGYCTTKMVVIPNGFDLEIFRPDSQKREEIRSELGLGPETKVVGLIRRFHPEKDIKTFFAAAMFAKKRLPSIPIQFVVCGPGLAWDNPTIEAWIHEYGLMENVCLLGPRTDVPEIMNSFDIFTISSLQESFANVIGEAMACGIPCVVTDVGDSARIVGDTGITVPTRSPEKLAQAWLKLLNLPANERKALGERARQQIVENFGLDLMVRRYEELYELVAR